MKKSPGGHIQQKIAITTTIRTCFSSEMILCYSKEYLKRNFPFKPITSFHTKIQQKVRQNMLKSNFLPSSFKNSRIISYSSFLTPQIQLLIIQVILSQHWKKPMESLCFTNPLNYYSLPLGNYLYPLQSFQNNFYYVVYPSSTGEDSRQISNQTIQRSVLLQERKDLEVGNLQNESSDFAKQKDGKNQRSLVFFNKNPIDQEFQVRERTKKKETLYKKKNTESNIINQALSFLNTERSLQMLSKLLDDDGEKIRWFYRIMATIKKANKRYTNRKYLKRLIEFAERSEFHRAYLKEKKQHIALAEFRIVIRKVIFYFIREYSYLSLMTSSKIYKETLRQHFWRKKEIERFLFFASEKNQ